MIFSSRLVSNMVAYASTIISGISFTLLAAAAIYIFFSIFKRIWIYHIDKNGIYGSDAEMLKYNLENNRRGWGLLCLHFDNNIHYSNIISTIEKKMTDILSQNLSPLKLGLNIEKKSYYVKHDITVKDLIHLVDNDGDFYCLNDKKNREISVRIYPEKNKVSCLFDHACFDGLELFSKILCPILDSKEFSSRWLGKDKYFPFLSELLQLHMITKSVKRSFLHKTLPTFENKQDQIVYHYDTPLSTFKDLKKQAGCSFNAALISHYIQKVFASLDQKHHKLNVGIIIGFSGDRYKNNYSILPIVVKRSENIFDYINQVNRQMTKNVLEAVSIYQMINTINIQRFFKKNFLDILFSPAIFHKHRGLSSHINDTVFLNAPTSSPIYAFACTLSDRIHISTTINTPDLSQPLFIKKATFIFKQTEIYHFHPS